MNLNSKKEKEESEYKNVIKALIYIEKNDANKRIRIINSYENFKRYKRFGMDKKASPSRPVPDASRKNHTVSTLHFIFLIKVPTFIFFRDASGTGRDGDAFLSAPKKLKCI